MSVPVSSIPAAVNAMAIDSGGNLYVVVAGEAIYTIDGNGTSNLFYAYSANANSHVRKMAFDSANRLWVDNGGSLEVFVGGVPQSAGLSFSIRSFAFDSTDNLYLVVEGENRIVRRTSSGVVSTVARDVINHAAGGYSIAVGTGGKIYISDADPANLSVRLVVEIRP